MTLFPILDVDGRSRQHGFRGKQSILLASGNRSVQASLGHAVAGRCQQRSTSHFGSVATTDSELQKSHGTTARHQRHFGRRLSLTRRLDPAAVGRIVCRQFGRGLGQLRHCGVSEEKLRFATDEYAASQQKELAILRCWAVYRNIRRAASICKGRGLRTRS
jgi:hypothetical protein